MKPIQLAVIGFIFLVGFLVWEIIFSTQKYGLPKFNLTPQPVAGSCKILEEKYCNKGKIIKSADYTYIGFNLPEGTQIFAPVDGQLSKAKINQPSPFQGFVATMNDAKNPQENYAVRGDLQFSNMLSENVRAGQTIGSVSNTGVKNFGSYNLIFAISKPDAVLGKFVSDINLLKQLFQLK